MKRIKLSPKNMFDHASVVLERQILFYATLDFSPNGPHSAAKSTWPKTKFAHFYLADASRQARITRPGQTCSNTPSPSWPQRLNKSVPFFALFCILTFTAFAQSEKPTGAVLMPLEEVDLVVLPRQDNAALLSEELKNRRPGVPPKFALSFPVAISPLKRGNWEELADGTTVWRIRILSPDAHSINLGFGEFFLPPGAELDLYSADEKKRLGPFSPQDNDDHGEFWTPIVEGDELVVELRLPKIQRKNLSLKITSINHDFLDFSTFASGSCNLDVICGAADGWEIVDAYRDIIQSVGVYSTGGNTFCTGFLVNNTREDCTPFFMTADHCGIRSDNAASIVVYWNFENSTCRAPNSAASGSAGNGVLNDFNTGSVLRARSSDTDFGLLELDDPVSTSAEGYFAGWDARTNLPTDTVIAIHHPGTDEKRISFSFEQVFKGNLNGQAVANGGYLVVPNWSIGTTEGGSSGCPLFDREQRIVGQLFGGTASCNNLDFDAFGWLAISWEGGGTAGTRLKDWLDPDNTGKTFIDGRSQNACNFRILAENQSFFLCDPSEFSFEIGPSDNFTTPVTLSAINLPGTATATFDNNPVEAGATTTIHINNLDQLSDGTYTFEVAGADATDDATISIALIISNSIPENTTPIAPSNEAEHQSTAPTLTWSAVENANAYEWQLSTSADFSTIVDGDEDHLSTMVDMNSLETETTYFWRVRAINACGSGDWSTAFSFTTSGMYCLINSAQDLPVAISPNAPNMVRSTLVVEQEGQIASIAVSMDIKHTYVSDLSANLIAPDGTSISLFNNPGDNVSFQGCSRDDLILSFNDEAPQDNSLLSNTCNNNTPTIMGLFKPKQPLADLNGKPAPGQWILEITDEFDEDGGSIDSWSLEICTTFPETATATASTSSISVCPGESFEFELIIGGGFNDAGLAIMTNELPAGASLLYEPDTPNAASTITISGSGFEVPGDYPITFTVSDGSQSANTTVDLHVRSVPNDIIAIGPQDGAQLVGIAPTFSWNANLGVSNYRIIVSTSPDLSDPVVDLNTSNNIINLGDLAKGQTYYWQIAATNECGIGESPIWSFTTIPDISFSTDPATLSICPDDSPGFSFTVDPDFLAPATLTYSSQPNSAIGLEIVGGLSDLSPGSTIDVSLTGLEGVEAGDYQLDLSLTDGNVSAITTLALRINVTPTAPTLSSPADQSNLAVPPNQLVWEAVPHIDLYQVEIAANPEFSPILESGQSTGTTYSPSSIVEGGTYFWRVSSSNDCGTAGAAAFQFALMPNAINEIDGNRIRIFPNPTLAKVQISFTQPVDQRMQLQLYHMNGKILQQTLIAAGQQQAWVSLADLPAGIYLLSLQTGSDRLIRRIVKQ